jgi:hypothetical protein
MNRKLLVFTTLGFIVVASWNSFLIHRDNKMFDAYYGESTNLK